MLGIVVPFEKRLAICCNFVFFVFFRVGTDPSDGGDA